MVSAWYMDLDPSDPTLEHHCNPPRYLTLEQLFNKTCVEYFHIAPEDSSKLDALRTQRGYTYEDEITCSEQCLPNFAEKLASFFREHLHTDEEIRYVLDGAGYFDVRDANDEWIRVQVVAGDLIIIPSGIYHRFTLDTRRYIKAKRYFVGEPVWLPHNRPADEMECRRAYLERLRTHQAAS